MSSCRPRSCSKWPCESRSRMLHGPRAGLLAALVAPGRAHRVAARRQPDRAKAGLRPGQAATAQDDSRQLSRPRADPRRGEARPGTGARARARSRGGRLRRARGQCPGARVDARVLREQRTEEGLGRRRRAGRRRATPRAARRGARCRLDGRGRRLRQRSPSRGRRALERFATSRRSARASNRCARFWTSACRLADSRPARAI